MTSISRLLLTKSRVRLFKCSVRTLKSLKIDDKYDKFIIRGPPKQTFRWTDEQKFPYELENPYKTPEPEPEPREYDKSTSEWHHVERLLPKLLIPDPKPKAEYPSTWKLPSENPTKTQYYVNRTRNHMYPVYLEIRNGGTRKLTTLRRIMGDIWVLENELKTHLESKHDRQIFTQVHEPAGMIRFKGDFVEEIKEWLGNSGF